MVNSNAKLQGVFQALICHLVPQKKHVKRGAAVMPIVKYVEVFIKYDAFDDVGLEVDVLKEI